MSSQQKQRDIYILIKKNLFLYYFHQFLLLREILY